MPHFDGKIWLSIYLPQLPLEAFHRDDIDARTDMNPPIAVVQNQRIIALSNSAAATGLTVGTLFSQAYALCDALICIDRDLGKEHHVLKHIAQWLYRFTPHIAIHGEQHLILEVSTSLTLFSGLKNLKAQIQEQLTELGYQAILCASQTPLASKVCAELGFPDNHHALPEHALADRQLNELMLPKEAVLKLLNMGVTTLKQLLDLPRPGISKRFGKPFIEHLDRLLGNRPDPQDFIKTSLEFEARLFFLDPIEHLQSLVFPLKRLLKDLSNFLTTHQKYIQSFVIALNYRGKLRAELSIKLAAPDNDLNLFLMLADIKLAQIKIAGEIDELILRAKQFKAASPLSKNLFESMPQRTYDVAPQAAVDQQQRDPSREKQANDLLNLLQTRLPVKTCFGITLGNDHRPEKHGIRVDLAAESRLTPDLLATDWATRPVFLFEKPQRLEKQINPMKHIDFELIKGPERINAAWWDGDGQNRDYYICRYKKRQVYWLFYRSLTHRWYLHGLFS